jgi:hypothetical protein
MAEAMATSEEEEGAVGIEGKGARVVWRLVWSGSVGRPDERMGLGAERERGLGKSLLHVRMTNPANKRTARAHPSLDGQNDCKVKRV